MSALFMLSRRRSLKYGFNYLHRLVSTNAWTPILLRDIFLTSALY